MVEVGQIEITGTMNDTDIEQGFDRIKSDFKDVENQANQTDASMSGLAGTAANLGKSLIAIGATGVAAVTALASKSPVVASSFAKIEVESLKLSNTLGGQLKPIFDSIGSSLIPSINNAFQRMDEDMTTFVGTVTNLIEALSDLIDLNWPGLIENLDKAFKPRILTDEPETPDEESTQNTLQGFGVYEDTFARAYESFQIPTNIIEWSQSMYSPIGTISKPSIFVLQGILDTFQLIFSNTNNKDMEIANATGTTRGD